MLTEFKDLFIKRLYDDTQLPTKAHEYDVGFDLYAHDVYYDGTKLKVDFGIAVEPPYGYWLMIAPRSSMIKKGIHTHTGIIDPNFRGELCLYFLGDTQTLCDIKKGDRVAQLVIMPMIEAGIRVVEELSSTERGNNGYGSSGK